MYAKLIFYGIMVLGMFLTVVGRKVLSHFSFIVTPCLPLSYQLHERQLLFYRRLLLSNNVVLRTLAGLPRVRFEMLGIADKYDIDHLRYSTETVKNAVWLSFVNNIRF